MDGEKLQILLGSAAVGFALGWIMRTGVLQVLKRVPPNKVVKKKGKFGSFAKQECKLVLVVRNDLKMGKGKIAAQCCHAAVMAYESSCENDPDLLASWRYYGQAKVATKCDSEDELFELYEAAQSAGLNANVVRDAGRTQIASGSVTVLAVGPGPSKAIDQVTGHLKLL